MKLPYKAMCLIGCIAMSGCASMASHERQVRSLVAQEATEYIEHYYNEKLKPACDGSETTLKEFEKALSDHIEKK